MPFDLLTVLHGWIQSQPVEIARTLNGGWERWASADMAIFMIRAAMPETDVVTEDNCYRPYDEVIGSRTERKTPRCDIAIKQKNNGVVSWDIVEVKCWRFVANTLKEFIGKIGSDIAKIRGNVLDDTGPYKPYKGSNRLWAIGLILASDVDPNFNAQQAKEKLEQSY